MATKTKNKAPRTLRPTWDQLSQSERKAAASEIRRSIRLHEEQLAKADDLGFQEDARNNYSRILGRYYALLDLATRHVTDPSMPRRRAR